MTKLGALPYVFINVEFQEKWVVCHYSFSEKKKFLTNWVDWELQLRCGDSDSYIYKPLVVGWQVKRRNSAAASQTLYQQMLAYSKSNSALASSLAISESNIRSSVGSLSSVLLLNIQSIHSSARSSTRWKIQYIRNNVEQKSRHISVPFIALTETWLKPYINDSQLDIDNYNISRCDCSTRVGGGVLLYSHESLPITSFETFDDKICQALLCKFDTAEIIIWVLYRPPDAPISSFKAFLEIIAYYISDHESYETCLLGDFNFPMID